MLKISSGFLERIKEVQGVDMLLQEQIKEKEEGKGLEFHKDATGIIRFKGFMYLEGKD